LRNGWEVAGLGSEKTRKDLVVVVTPFQRTTGFGFHHNLKGDGGFTETPHDRHATFPSV